MKIKWTGVEHKAFYDIKCSVSQATLWAYPDFNERFDIHMDANDYQLVSVISQNVKPIAFYRHKLIVPQSRYTVT